MSNSSFVNSATSVNIDWAALLQPADRIICSQMTAEPRALLRSLCAFLASGDADKRMPTSVFLGTPFSDVCRALPPAVELQVFGGMGAAGAIGRVRPLSVLPVHYSVSAQLFATKVLPVDVVLLSLGCHPATGQLYLGASHGHALAAARQARVVIAEVNRCAPCLPGGELPSDIRIDLKVEIDEPLQECGSFSADGVEQQIAAGVASRVPDGATLQVGIGSLAGALLQGLGSHRRLGVHSGLITPPLWELVRSGVVDNVHKGRDHGVSVCSAVFGDAVLYAEWAACGAVHLAPPEVTHGVTSLGGLQRFTALNSALEVDLLGQVNSESVGSRYIGGVGGLNDFVRGAAASPGGQSIVALPSRRVARGVQAPSVVPDLSGPASIPASDADLFVSEYGVASLRGASRDQRAARLIAIAHPEDREALRAAARDKGLSV